MTDAPNPFADEPLPANLVRLQSAANPLDPYAAPAGIEHPRPVRADPGIGMWRDGNFLVLHDEASFPARCVLTNVPTEIFRRQTLTWHYPVDWNYRQLELEFGISPANDAAMTRTRRRGLLTAAVCALLSCCLLPLASDWGWLGTFAAGGLLLSVAALAVALRIVWQVGDVLKFHQVRRSYFWIGGVQRPFLESLPSWPGLGG